MVSEVENGRLLRHDSAPLVRGKCECCRPRPTLSLWRTHPVSGARNRYQSTVTRWRLQSVLSPPVAARVSVHSAYMKVLMTMLMFERHAGQQCNVWPLCSHLSRTYGYKTVKQLLNSTRWNPLPSLATCCDFLRHCPLQQSPPVQYPVILSTTVISVSRSNL